MLAHLCRGAALSILLLGIPSRAQEISPPGLPSLVGPEDTFVELTAESEEAIQRGLDYLASSQLPSGGWESRYGENVGVSAIALLSFLAAGHLPGEGKYGPVLERGTDFLLSHAAPSGFICNPKAASHGPMYSHALATLFLSEVYGHSERPEIPGAIQAAVQVIVHSQNEEGGWRYQPRVFDADISVSVMQIVALRGAKSAGFQVPRETIVRAMNYVRDCSHNSGGFTYQAKGGEPGYARTAAGVCSLQVCGDYHSQEVEMGLDYLLANIRRAEEDRYYYGIYYAAQAVYQAKDERRWTQWFPLIRDGLIAKQLDNGAWNSDEGAAYSTGLALLVLAVPYRCLPIYQR